MFFINFFMQSINQLDSEAGHRAKPFKVKGASLNWVSEDYVTDEGKPIGIGGAPRGATAEKGEIILETSAEELLDVFIDCYVEYFLNEPL